jgi:hypothetical protein
MTKLSQLKNEGTDRAKVIAWLDEIQEFDEACRNEVLELCSKDIEYRKAILKNMEETK